MIKKHNQVYASDHNTDSEISGDDEITTMNDQLEIMKDEMPVYIGRDKITRWNVHYNKKYIKREKKI